MAVTYNNTKIGRAGGPSVQQIRDNAFVSVSGIGHPTNLNGNGAVLLADASAITGSLESYYLVWGLVAGSAHIAASSFAGAVYDTGIAHSAGTIDGACINTFACCKEGPYFLSLDHPLHVTRGAGVKLDAQCQVNQNILYIYYTLIE
tara:strand:+ start:5600 stop:6040 length:441 start_codon:yes stop_codon:yes gene_type:complete